MRRLIAHIERKYFHYPVKYSKRVTIAIDIGGGGGCEQSHSSFRDICGIVGMLTRARRFSLSNSGLRFSTFPAKKREKSGHILPGKISPGHLHYLETITRDIEVWSECNCADKRSEVVVNPLVLTTPFNVARRDDERLFIDNLLLRVGI